MKKTKNNKKIKFKRKQIEFSMQATVKRWRYNDYINISFIHTYIHIFIYTLYVNALYNKSVIFFPISCIMLYVY